MKDRISTHTYLEAKLFITFNKLGLIPDSDKADDNELKLMRILVLLVEEKIAKGKEKQPI